jgi:hypothetical protein
METDEPGGAGDKRFAWCCGILVFWYYGVMVLQL